MTIEEIERRIGEQLSALVGKIVRYKVLDHEHEECLVGVLERFGTEWRVVAKDETTRTFKTKEVIVKEDLIVNVW